MYLPRPEHPPRLCPYIRASPLFTLRSLLTIEFHFSGDLALPLLTRMA